jgi:hypothetical protein
MPGGDHLMRFALVDVCAAALVAVAGCGPVSFPFPEGAWSVSLISGTGGVCPFPNSKSMTGSITDQVKNVVVSDDTLDTIECSVAPASAGVNAFSVVAFGEDLRTHGSSLSMLIPSITAETTVTNPALGSVELVSAATFENAFVGRTCNFFFSSPSEGVSPGQTWVTFDCPTVTNGQTMSTCSIARSFAIFENCATQ